MKVHSDIRSCLIPLQSFAQLYYQAPLVVGKCTNHLAFSSTKSGPNVWTIRTLCEPNYTRWIVAWLRPNVASAPWKVFAMWIRLVLTWHIHVYPGFLAPSLPSHVCRLNCLNIEAWELISSFGIKHLGANNAIPRRHQQKCRWHQKKTWQKQEDLCTTHTAHQERMPYESALSQYSWSFLKRRCFIWEWARCVCVRACAKIPTNKRPHSDHNGTTKQTCLCFCNLSSCKKSRSVQDWLQHASYDCKWMKQWNSSDWQKQG